MMILEIKNSDFIPHNIGKLRKVAGNNSIADHLDGVVALARSFVEDTGPFVDPEDSISRVEALIQELRLAEEKLKNGDDAGFVGDFLVLHSELT